MTPKMSTRNIELSVGAFGPTFPEQMAAQGLTIPDRDMEHLEKDRAALARLGVRGVLSTGERDRAAVRLLKQICAKATPL